MPPRVAVREFDDPPKHFRVPDSILNVLVGMARSSHPSNPSKPLTCVNYDSISSDTIRFRWAIRRVSVMHLFLGRLSFTGSPCADCTQRARQTVQSSRLSKPETRCRL